MRARREGRTLAGGGHPGVFWWLIAGGSRGARLRTGGFTLIEIMLVIAILMLTTVVFVANMDRLIDGLNEPSPEEWVDTAVKRSRLLSVTLKSVIYLLQDVETGELLAQRPNGELVDRFECPGTGRGGRPLRVRFRALEAETYSLAGVWRRPLKLSGVDYPSMEFWPGGGASFCVIEMETDPADTHYYLERMLYDPFSNARIEADL